MATPTRQRLGIAGLLMIVAVLIVSYAIQPSFKPPALEDVFTTGSFIVGVDPSYPPFALDQDGVLVGLDVDIANAIGELLGLDLQFATLGYDGLYDAVVTGQVDIVLSAVLINPARNHEVRYTMPYFNNGLMLISPIEQELTGMNMLAEQRLALEYGSVAHSYARTWQQQIRPFAILPYELPGYALDALRINQSDAALVDATSYYLYLQQHTAWQSAANYMTDAYFAGVIRIDRGDIYYWMETALQELQSNGTLQTIIERWL